MDRLDVAICGNGAASATLFRALARTTRKPLAVSILGPGSPFAGAAYGTHDPAHVLNVPAEKMSADASEPSQFADWLRDQGIAVPGWAQSFVRRELYGRYLSGLAERTRLEFRDRIELTVAQAEVLGLARQTDGWTVFHTEGVSHARNVVLATGHGPPQSLGAHYDEDVAHAIIDDPWSPWNVEATARVLVIGTGLTAIDTALSLLGRGHRGQIVLLSRHGRLPQVHVAHGAGTPLPGPYPARASTLVRSLRSAVSRDAPAEDWQAFVDAMRPYWHQAWAELDEAGKRRALRHGLNLFNAHRHRIAPRQGSQIAEAIAAGRIEVVRGRLVDLAPACNSVRARIATRSGEQELTFGRVVNCSGPNSDPERGPGTLLKTLIARGRARPGPAGLGIDVDDQDRVLSGDGTVQPGLFAMGALTRGKWWEITAMPEITSQAGRIAQFLAARQDISAWALSAKPTGRLLPVT